MEKYNFTEINLTEEKKNELTQNIIKYKNQKRCEEVLKGELEKTSNEYALINQTESFINNELLRLSLPNNFKIDPKEIHFLPTNDNQYKENIGTSGAYSMQTERVYLFKKNEENKKILNKIEYFIESYIRKIFNKNIKEEKFETIIHESIHSSSHHKYIGDKVPTQYRIGYELIKNRVSKNIKLFEGFNESVVQKTTLDILNHEDKNGKEYINNLIDTMYSEHMFILDQIIKKISIVKNQSQNEVWERFKKAQFTGEMMHLRDVEGAFGPGSLRVLSSIRASEPPHRSLLYYTYFSTDNKEAKDIIARILLNNNKTNKKEYLKHKNKMRE